VKNIVAIVLYCLFASSCLQAADFDCAQALSTPERIICESVELSKLDTRLGEAYRAAKSKASLDKAKRLATEQRQWLRSIRNRCVDADCLLDAYKARLNELDPFADNRLTCEEMRRFPEIAFSGGIDLGSGFGSPIEVDYQCPESMSQQKFMLRLIALAEQVRGDTGPQVCTGSIVHAQWRYYLFTLAEAGFSPRMLVQDRVPFRTHIDWNSFKDAEGSDNDKQVIRYFKQWSERSLFNLALYSKFTSEFDRVLPTLAKHYEVSFGMPKRDAQIAARSALMLVVQRAAGGFPQRELKEESILIQAVRDSRSEYKDIRRKLNDAEGNPNLYSEDEIYNALIVALSNNRSLKIVSALAEALSPETLRHLGEAKEPLLSFAIGSQQNLEYLLSKKVPVNAANGFGKSALFYAIAASKHQAVEVLLGSGADVNHAYKSAKELRPDDDKCVYPGLSHTRRTPLMHAAQHSDIQMIAMLLKAGARLEAIDDLGYNALDYAALRTNKDNKTYLKSLGLEFGAPKYSSTPDPSVREQTVQESIPIDGFVSKLLTAPGRPDILVAAVRPWDALVAGDRHGLYLISISDPNHPEVISNLPAVYANDFALSPDGKRAYVMEIAHDKAPSGKKFGLSVIDITNPKKPTLSEQIEGDFMTMHLSPDGKLLYLQERTLKPEFSRGLLVYNVGSERARMECSNSFGNVEFYGPVFAYAFASFPDEPLLLIYDKSQRLILFDVKDPCNPARLTEIRTEHVDGQMFGTAGRTIVSGGSGGLWKFRITDSLERMAGYEASTHAYFVDAATGYVTAVIDKDVAVFRIKGTGRFKLTDRFRLPNEYVGSVLQSNAGHIYMGWRGGLGVGLIPVE